jgi:hypothetical protein
VQALLSPQAGITIIIVTTTIIAALTRMSARNKA